MAEILHPTPELVKVYFRYCQHFWSIILIFISNDYNIQKEYTAGNKINNFSTL